jgi:hypothetical protein
MKSPVSRRLLGSGALAALLLPVLLNLVVHPQEGGCDVLDLGAAGPFELLANGAPGRPISTIAKGGAFAWTFHYCLTGDQPGTEVAELRRTEDGAVISRRAATVVLGPDHCVEGSATQRIPIDAAPGTYELARRLILRSRGGITVASVMASIPIEVTR